MYNKGNDIAFLKWPMKMWHLWSCGSIFSHGKDYFAFIYIWEALRDLVPFVQFRVLLLAKFQTKICNFTKSSSHQWLFFMFFKLYKWYQIAQNIIQVSYNMKNTFSIFQVIPFSHISLETGIYCKKSTSTRGRIRKITFQLTC